MCYMAEICESKKKIPHGTSHSDCKGAVCSSDLSLTGCILD